MATLTDNEITRAGFTEAMESAAGGGDEFLNDGSQFLRIANGDASPMDVTIVSQSTVDGLAVADRVVTVAAGTVKLIGPFSPGVYNDANGKVQLTYSSATSLTVGVFHLGTP